MTETSRWQQRLLICSCLALATAAVYWPVRHFEFTNYDDGEYVYENAQVQSRLTLRGLAWAFTTNHASNWHPLTWISHMLDCQWFGLNAGGHHLVNVLFHIANTLLLFGILRRMTGASWRSGVVAGLFALHPLHVASVAWVAERKDVLSAFFWMLTMWAYVRCVEHFTVHSSRSKVFYGLTLLFFAFGLMAKPMVVTLPFVLLLLDYWPLGRTRWVEPATGKSVQTPLSQLLREKLPFLVLVAASCVLTCWAQRWAVQPLDRLPAGDRVANAAVSYLRYLGKVFWPEGLAIFYPYHKWPLDTVAGAVAVLIAVSAWVIWRGRREPQLVVGWLWYLGTLVPVIGFVQVGIQSMADRYTYLPLIGFFMMVAWGIPRGAVEQRVGRMIIVAAIVLLLGVCAVLSRLQVGYWRNGVTAFERALAVTKDDHVVHFYLGSALAQEGRLEEALGHFEQALRIKPHSADLHYNLAHALALLGRTPEAASHLEQALRINPNDAVRHCMLADLLRNLGKAPEAIGHYEQALRLKPDYAEARNNLAWLLATLTPAEGGDPVRAVTLAQRACEMTGNRAAAYLDTLAVAYAAAGRFADAIATAQKAIELAQSAKRPQLAQEINARLELYRSGRAYRRSVDTTRSDKPR